MYTKPGLRERLKIQITKGTKGGRANQWSARKAQLLAVAYKKAGGGYTKVKGPAGRSLTKWTAEKWRTSGGKRYLPDAAWKKLTQAERRATNRKKAIGKGQFVPNTKAAAPCISKEVRSYQRNHQGVQPMNNETDLRRQISW